MKEVSFLKTMVGLTIAYYLFTSGTHFILPNYVNHPMGDLRKFLWKFIQPQIERNIVQEPEAFMTTVSN